jgi:hypothetical protein
MRRNICFFQQKIKIDILQYQFCCVCLKHSMSSIFDYFLLNNNIFGKYSFPSLLQIIFLQIIVSFSHKNLVINFSHKTLLMVVSFNKCLAMIHLTSSVRAMKDIVIICTITMSVRGECGFKGLRFNKCLAMIHLTSSLRAMKDIVIICTITMSVRGECGFKGLRFNKCLAMIHLTSSLRAMKDIVISL